MSIWTLPVLLGESLNPVYFGLMFRSLFHYLRNIRAKLTEFKYKGPTLGPVVGGYLSESMGWRWDFWFLVIAVSVIFPLFC
jgi:MFS family permease